MTPKEAKELCIKAHKGQWRRWELKPVDYSICDEEEMKFINGAGYYRKPYHTHPIAVADMLSTDDEKIVAYLHDVIEDTEWFLYNSKTPLQTYICKDINKRYGLEVIYAIALEYLTHLPNETYKDYIKRLTDTSKAPLHTAQLIAIKVKIADITHNLSETSSEHAKQKYLEAIPILLSTL